MLEQRLPFWFLHTPVDTSCHACPAPVFSVSPTGQVAVPVFAGRTKDAEDNSLTTGFGFEHGIDRRFCFWPAQGINGIMDACQIP